MLTRESLDSPVARQKVRSQYRGQVDPIAGQAQTHEATEHLYAQ